MCYNKFLRNFITVWVYFKNVNAFDLYIISGVSTGLVGHWQLDRAQERTPAFTPPNHCGRVGGFHKLKFVAILDYRETGIGLIIFFVVSGETDRGRQFCYASVSHRKFVEKKFARSKRSGFIANDCSKTKFSRKY